MGRPLIEVVDPDPTWSVQYTVVEDAVAAALGSLALRIDHIGSTAVPGLAAKDIIDVQVTVAALSNEIIEAMVGAGFVFRADLDHDLLIGADDPAELRKLVFVEAAGARRTNIHVREVGRRNQRYALLFRDHLRADADVRAAYGAVKRVLAREYPDDLDRYYDVKDPVMDIIYRGAELWAAETGWPAS